MSWKLYLTGGSCRDKFLGIENPKDLDFAVECVDGYAGMRAEILKLGGTIYLERPEFFAIRANIPGIGPSDFTLCRKESFYSDGRHPDSVEPGTILDDLSRRDATINAIAQNWVTKEIIDPWHGIRDIEYKFIRAVGDPNDRLSEDPLRGYRYLRFSITKQFSIEWNLNKALQDLPIIKLSSVKPERVREELFKMFEFNTPLSLLLVPAYDVWFRYAFQNCGIKLIPTLRK